MKIVDICTIPLKAKFRFPSKFAFGTRTHSFNILVKIISEEGVIGYGEACPVPFWSSESGQSVVEAIENYIKPALIGKDPRNIASLNNIMDKVLFGNNFAKSAVDMALYDLVGKYLNVPVHMLIGGKFRDKIEVNSSVGIGSSTEMVQKCKEIINKGYKTIKIYGGKDSLKDEIEHFEAIRKEIGYKIKIYLEVNQQWSVSNAIKCINALQKYDLLFVEQPVSRWDLKGLMEIKNRSPIPIAADESVDSLQSIFQFASNRYVDIVNLYVQKTGGIYRTHQAISLLEAANTQCFMGSLLELGVATAAAIHLAASIKDLKLPCYLVGPEKYLQDIVKPPLNISDGYIEVPTGPGLGIDIDDDIVNKMRA